VDAVLGLSVTSSAVGLVLVEGSDPDGAAINGAGFEVATSQQAADAVRRTEEIAAQRGQRLQSIGVTWSDEAALEASLLLTSLSDSGFDNIVPVRLSEATDALARGIADLVGYGTTAVCVVEPGQLIALVVRPDDGAVQTAVNSTVVTEEDLIGWLSAVFARADWEPEALVLVGSAEDLDGLAPVLEDALGVPVFSPAEAQLALARGAALACSPPAENLWDEGFWDEQQFAPAQAAVAQPRSRRLLRVGPPAMLTAGLVAFVVSLSTVLGLQFVPDRPVPTVRTAAETSVPDPVPPVAEVPAPAPTQDPVEAPAQETTEEPVGEVTAPPAVEEPAPDVAPVEPVISDPAPVEPAPVEAPAVAPPPPDVIAPPPVPAQPQEPGLLDRIRDRLAGLGQPPVAPPPPPPALP
jgi:hypothetical protein